MSSQWISREYFGLNGSSIETLATPPTSLEFSRLVHISRPVLIRGFELPALNLWTDRYLTEQLGDRLISVAVTPDGRADAIARGPDREEYFVEPYVQKMTMTDLLGRLSPENHTSEIYYLQSQNGNMFSTQDFEDDGASSESEFRPLRSDIASEIPWCSEALGQHPEAVNLWIGNSRSVTSIHNDPYENIYTVIKGEKHFTLLPPTEGWCLREQFYPHATYTRMTATGPLVLKPSPSTVSPVRWSSIQDPDLPGSLSSEAHPIRVTLRAGDTLYLPVGWWHHVRQSGDPTIAVNWWYDTESRGMTWVWLNFLRGIRDAGSSESDSDLEDCA